VSFVNILPCCLGLGVYCLGLEGNCLGLEPWCLGLGLGVYWSQHWRDDIQLNSTPPEGGLREKKLDEAYIYPRFLK